VSAANFRLAWDRTVYPHCIRLRGPWECESPAGGPPRRVTLPGPGATGPVRLRRRFGYPGRIDASERVWITFVGFDGEAAVVLNGTPLGGFRAAGEFEATTLLRSRNELLIDTGAATWGEVALEVRAPAFLRGVRVEAAERGGAVALHAQGEIIGTSDGPLELYVVLDRSSVAYAVAGPGPFHLTAEGLDRRPWDERPEGLGPRPVARVDLVRGATVWYRVEQEVPLGPAPTP
jgi:hypothetical protein